MLSPRSLANSSVISFYERFNFKMLRLSENERMTSQRANILCYPSIFPDRLKSSTRLFEDLELSLLFNCLMISAAWISDNLAASSLRFSDLV